MPEFNEAIYLAKYSDVAEAVARKVLPNGKAHYLRYGIHEGRTDTLDLITNASPLWITYKQFAQFHPKLEDFTFFQELVEKINHQQSFHLARYNDGEWVFMLRIPPHFQECLKHHDHDEKEVTQISNRLLQIIESSPDYYIGVDSTTRAHQGLVFPYSGKLRKKLALIKNLVYGDVFNAATIRFGIDCLLNPLKKRFVISVGPAYMTQLGISAIHIPVPKNNCWADASIESQLQTAISTNLHQKPVIIYSCSLLAKLLVHIFYEKYTDRITQLDIGSCIDPWCGVISRPWHQELIKHYLLPKPDFGIF